MAHITYFCFTLSYNQMSSNNFLRSGFYMMPWTLVQTPCTTKNKGLNCYWMHNCRFPSTSVSYAALEDSFRLRSSTIYITHKNEFGSMVGGLGFPQVCKIWWSICYDPPVMKALSSLQWIVVHALIICIVLCCENQWYTI